MIKPGLAVVFSETDETFRVYDGNGNHFQTAKLRKLAPIFQESLALMEALKQISDGDVMRGRKDFTLAEVVLEYTKIARAALAKAEGKVS